MKRSARRRRRWSILVAVTAAVVGVLLVMPWYHRRSIEVRLAVYDPLIREQVKRTGLPRGLIRSVIRAESGARADAVSGKQAVGLMQVRSDAEADALKMLHIPRGDLYDPAYNLLIGTTYLKHLSDRFGGDHYLMMAAYHMGQTRVQEILDQHPGRTGPQLVEQYTNPTTRGYVLKVVEGE